MYGTLSFEINLTLTCDLGFIGRLVTILDAVVLLDVSQYAVQISAMLSSLASGGETAGNATEQPRPQAAYTKAFVLYKARPDPRCPE